MGAPGPALGPHPHPSWAGPLACPLACPLPWSRHPLWSRTPRTAAPRCSDCPAGPPRHTDSSPLAFILQSDILRPRHNFYRASVNMLDRQLLYVLLPLSLPGDTESQSSDCAGSFCSLASWNIGGVGSENKAPQPRTGRGPQTPCPPTSRLSLWTAAGRGRGRGSGPCHSLLKAPFPQALHVAVSVVWGRQAAPGQDGGELGGRSPPCAAQDSPWASSAKSGRPRSSHTSWT